MFAKVMAAALAIGATGGAGLAVAENFSAPRTQEVAQRESKVGDLCQPVAFRVYFEPGSARLNDDAHNLIDSASRQVAGCDKVEFSVAADADQIGDAAKRRTASQRSVAILSAMRAQGIEGEVYVQNISHTVVAAEANAGPDFIEIQVAPSETPRVFTSNSRQTDM
jgi:outer membrane protein OmpA-like peptidoglycan-associated protein